MVRVRRGVGSSLMPAVLAMMLVPGCGARDRGAAPAGRPVIGVSFDTLQTEFWVASRDTLEAEIRSRGGEMLLAVANNDANRQLEQVRGFLARGVTGIVIAPKDAQAVVPIIKAANRAGVPIVLYNRPPAEGAGKSTTVVADNYEITKKTVEFMADQARKSGRKSQALVLIGDLGDINAIGRRDGFEAAVAAHADVIEVVARVPTEWNQEKALAGVTNALQASPGINFIFSSSDFLFPSIVSALQQAGKYKKADEEGHVLLGGFDGDATAFRMLSEGYLDADGVQDLDFECKQAIQAIFDLREGKEVPATIADPGFVAHRGNLDEARKRMWGARLSERHP